MYTCASNSRLLSQGQRWQKAAATFSSAASPTQGPPSPPLSLSHTLSLHFTPSLYFEFVTLSVVSAVADAAATAVVVVFVVMGQSQFCPVVIEVVVVVAAVVDVDVVHLFARVYLFNSNASRRSRSIIFRSSIH